MGFFKDLQIGISSYGKAVGFIFRHRLVWFFLFPILLNVLLFSVSYGLISEISESLIAYLKAAWETNNWNFWGGEFLAATINFTIWLILRILFFLIYAFIGGYLILLLLSPILAFLSEKTEKIILQSNHPFTWLQLFKDIWRGIRIALRNFMLELAAIILLFFISFIPVIGAISAPLLFVISAYYYGFSFIDYTAERRQLNIKESIHYVRKNSGLAIANGAPFALALLIPFIGVSLSGFLAIISTVAAALSIVKKEEKHPQRRTNS